MDDCPSSHPSTETRKGDRKRDSERGSEKTRRGDRKRDSERGPEKRLGEGIGRDPERGPGNGSEEGRVQSLLALIRRFGAGAPENGQIAPSTGAGRRAQKQGPGSVSPEFKPPIRRPCELKAAETRRMCVCQTRGSMGVRSGSGGGRGGGERGEGRCP